MILADANVLIYAFRSDTPRHAVCRPWLEGMVRGEAQFGLSPQVLGAVARITTNPRIFRDNLLGQPHGQVVQPGPRHWAIFERLCVEADAKGPLVADAWFAALAIEQGCLWIICDRDYARFPGLDWREPT